MLVQTKNLTKKYSTHNVVDSVNIQIQEGDIYGLVGQNGAGKTTLMKMIVGITTPTSGECILFDGKKDKKFKIGALIEQPGYFPNESALENMKRNAIISNAHTCSLDEIKRILEMVKLSHTGKKKVKNFSLGMKQRLGIAIALLGNPELLVLDEPTNGLDPIGIKEIRELLINLSKNGVTIFISSHIIDELARIANRYGIMHYGKLLKEISDSDLDEIRQSTYSIQVSDVEKSINIIENNTKLSAYSDNGLLFIESLKEEDKDSVIELLSSNDIRIESDKGYGVSIEQYFTNKVR